MHVGVAEAGAVQTVPLDAREHLLVRGDGGRREGLQELKDGAAVAQIPAGQLADDVRVAEDLAVLQRALEVVRAVAEMGDPEPMYP